MRSIVPGSRGSALLCHDAHEWPYLLKNHVSVTHVHRPNSVNVTLSAHVRLELATWIGETVGLLSQMWSKGAGASGKTKGGMHLTKLWIGRRRDTDLSSISLTVALADYDCYCSSWIVQDKFAIV